MRAIDNLVFKGGGVLGTAYAGAIDALNENDLLKGIKRVAGTSAGAITAALVCLKYTSQEIDSITRAINFKSFEDHFNPLRLISEYGLFKGDAFLDWIKGIIKAKTGNANITFAEFTQKGFLDLRVFATDLNSAGVKEFSAQTTPHTFVAESLRASMSVAFMWKAWQFSNHQPDDHLYIDGGTVYNYPITTFGTLDNTLGFFLYGKEANPVNLVYDEPVLYLKQLYKSMTNAQDIDFETDKEEKEVTVMINNLGISSMDLDITDEQKQALFDSGKKATNDYLKIV